MKMFCRLVLSLAILPLFAHCNCVPSEPANPDHVLETTLDLMGQNTHVSKLIDTVNALRRLGKKRAVDVLVAYTEDRSDIKRTFDVNIICRCLFVCPYGRWQVPESSTEPQTIVAQQQNFPYFPVAFSDGMPFLLVVGYGSIGGRPPEPGRSVLRQWQDFDLIDKDLPAFDETKGAEAAQKLIDSPEFQKLYVGGPGRSAFIWWQVRHLTKTQGK